MKKMIMKNPYRILLWMLLLAVLVACKQQTATTTTTVTPGPAVYTGVLKADYENALDVIGQLALGTLRLEETAYAVTSEQAAQLLPLWKALQGSALKTEAERLAVAKQIENTLTTEQVTAIVALHLTQADAEAWLREQGPLGGAPGGQMPAGGQGAPTGQTPGSGRGASGGQMPFGGMGAGGNAPTLSEEERAAMRERFANMSEEERAQLQQQFRQRSGNAPGGATMTNPLSAVLMRAVVTLLTERGRQLSTVTPQATTPAAAPPATATPIATPTATPFPIVTLAPWRTVEPTITPALTPTSTQAANATLKPAAAATTAKTGMATPMTGAGQTATQTIQGVLTQKRDTDPAPPLTIEITTNYAEPNPLLEGGLIYKIAGLVHNPTEETYTVTAVHVTFFDADGFRGAFYAFPMRPGQRGIQGEWIHHGAMEEEISCSVLGPGESCPFTAEIAGQNMASFLVHPDAQVVEWHESAQVTLQETKIEETGVNFIRISGIAVNPNPYPLKNVIISGLLIDAHGQTVSLGTGVVPSLATGASAKFEVYVEKKAYATYRLYARAEQDAK